MWYGVSSIAARFINYLLTPYLTFKFSNAQYGEMSTVYSFLPFMNVLVTHGMETAFFRYGNHHDKKAVHSNTSISMVTATILFSILLILLQVPLASLLQIQKHPEYLSLCAAIIGLDALSTIPFAKLRQDARPMKFAAIKIGGILINIISIYFFLSVCPSLLKENPDHWAGKYFNKDWAVGYVLLANLIQSAATLLLLAKEFLGFQLKFDVKLWREMMVYGLPLILAGFAGMINETFDRIMLGWWAPVASEEAAKAEVGIYSACYKLSILISLGVQAFRMGAEPFFFKQAQENNARKIYARVMKFFVIVLCLMFLSVALYLNIWKGFIDSKMHSGLKVVPILLWANIFLGIYYNLSVWYKLGNKTIAGAYITLVGAAITLIINGIFIRYYSYMACAWATFFCYGSMMVLSFVWGQREYRIPYAWKKLVAYMVIVALIFFIHKGVTLLWGNVWFSHSIATLLVFIYCWFILLVEKKEFKQMPVIGKFIK